VSDGGAVQRPLRVGLNLLFMGEGAGGVGRYATELVGALLAADPATELHLFVARHAPTHLRRQPWSDQVRWVEVAGGAAPPPVGVAAEFLALPALARARQLDVLHSPANTGPVQLPGVASVVTLHDLIWLHRAAEWSPSRWAQLRTRALVHHCVRHADRIFAVSQAAAEDISQTLGVASDRIEVTRSGVRIPTPPPAHEAERARAQLALGDGRVVLCVAQKRPYKNLASLIRALPALEPDVFLVIPSAPTAHENELRALAAELGVAERIRLPGWLEEQELEGIYACSQVFVLPSLIEGFGLPVLEAMARGVPVACSNVSALPEVAGDAALLFDPTRQDEVTGAIRRLLEDRALAEQLIARGFERARAFTWERTGAASLAGYRHAIAARGT